MFGSFGDVWYLSDESNKQIVVYYDKDGVIEHILLEERYTDSSIDVEETTEKWDLIISCTERKIIFLCSRLFCQLFIKYKRTACYNFFRGKYLPFIIHVYFNIWSENYCLKQW